jgi:carbon-monoxide dehydrogenase medium subunit
LEPFDFVSPSSIDEAVKTLASSGDDARILAGGTDMLVQMRAGRRTAPLVVDIKGIPELNAVTYDASKGLTLGAAVPCYEIYQDEKLAAAYPGLMDCATLIGGIQIQGRASIGGNICNAAPSGDSIPAVIVLGGICNVAGPSGTREIPTEDFCTAPGQNVLQNGELLVSISFPAPQPNSGANYQRFIPRNEMDIAVAGVGSSVQLDASGQNFVSARVSLASVAPTPVFAKEAGDSLAGKAVSEDAIQQASELAMAAAKPISDMRGTIRQRTHLIGVLTRRSLNNAVERARGG